MLDNFISGKKKNLSHHKKENVRIFKTDISKNEELDRYFKGDDYVFHLAGLAEIIPSIKNPKKYFLEVFFLTGCTHFAKKYSEIGSH